MSGLCRYYKRLLTRTEKVMIITVDITSVITVVINRNAQPNRTEPAIKLFAQGISIYCCHIHKWYHWQNSEPLVCRSNNGLSTVQRSVIFADALKTVVSTHVLSPGQKQLVVKPPRRLTLKFLLSLKIVSFLQCSCNFRTLNRTQTFSLKTKLKQPTSWKPVSRIKWRHGALLGYGIMTLYSCEEMVTILSRGSPYPSNFLFQRQWKQYFFSIS